MAVLATFNTQPEAILYMPLPHGKADVWLRKDIEQGQDEVGSAVWIAREVYFRTELSKDEIEANFDAIFDNGSPVVDQDTGKETADGVTIADRLEALEAAVLELAEVVTNG